MSSLEVSDTTVAGVLDKLRKGEWLVPQFQRDFVWSTDQVASLVQSIVEARPIGMVTLWEQADTTTLSLEMISIPDFDQQTSKTFIRPYCNPEHLPKRKYALLDGRQRCTAIAMAFGGFRASHGSYKYSGRYFLDVTEEEPKNRIRYFKEADVKAKNLHIDSTCVSQGLFALSSNKDTSEEVFPQWARYIQALHDASNYPNGVLPDNDELQKRNRILQDAFRGISETRLAVYTVSERYSLADICDIFETLNTTGTKVSTVDLIHSWLYSDTVGDPLGAFLLREWINDLGQKDGAIGWASSKERPELIAQIVTACHVALENKSSPRSIGGNKPQSISSIKSGDLLATPVEHWKSVQINEDTFATYLGDAQRAAAGGYFPWKACPYPALICIYVALRWHLKFDLDSARSWSRDELDAVYKAFFWRTAITRRYDQGFLTKVGSDIFRIKSWLNQRGNFSSSSQWAVVVENELDEYLDVVLPSQEDLEKLLTDSDPGGALGKALCLPMLAGVRKDLVNTGISLEYPASESVELHHIYPKEWCRNNKAGALADVLDPEKAGSNYMNSVSNLMPLSRTSNNNWRQKIPGQFIAEKSLHYSNVQDVLRPVFIDEQCFENLKSSNGREVEAFWKHRAKLIAKDIISRTKVML